MVGIIVTGHASYASGLYSALEFICGTPEFCIPVDFDGDEERFHAAIASAIDTLSECSQLLALCDLKGGTPFKYMASLSLSSPGLNVAYGISLPLLIEAVTGRDDQSVPDAKALIYDAMELVGLQTGVFSMPAVPDSDEDE